MSRGRARRAARSLSLGLAAALVAPLALLVSAGAAEAAPRTNALEPQTLSAVSDVPAGATELRSGQLDWGVRGSIRSYLENFGHTEGYVASYDGARYRKGDPAAHFPLAAGWIDEQEDTAHLEFTGRLRMHGFGQSWLHFENVRLDIAAGEASITVDMRESFGRPKRTDDLVLATFPLVGEDPVRLVDGVAQISSEDGTFPAEIGTNHLPRMDGQATYGGDNAYTDPFSLTVRTSADTGGTPDPDPGTTPDPGTKPDPDPGTKPDPDPGTDPTPVTPTPTAKTPHGESSATNAAGAALTVSPAYGLADQNQRLTLRGTGFPTTGSDGTNFGGLYVLFGWVDPAAGQNWGPGNGGASGRTFTYTQDIEPQGTYQSMVSYPGNGTVPGFPTMSADGSFEMELPIQSSRFESQHGISVDCYEMQCGVLLIGAHGKQNAKGEIFVPVYFTDSAEETGTAKPELPAVAPPTANPNVAQAAGGAQGQAAGLGVNGGLAAAGAPELARLALFGGVLLISAGALGGALLFRASRRTTSLTPPTPIGVSA